MRHFTIGIDPGKSGGLVYLNGDEVYDFTKMPDIFKDILKVLDSYRQIEKHDTVYCYIEQVQYRPHQKGVMTTLSNYGRIIGYLEALDIPYTVVPPQRWKKYFKLENKPKVDSVNLANQMFGIELRKTQDGIAEALLIARYGQLTKRR